MRFGVFGAIDPAGPGMILWINRIALLSMAGCGLIGVWAWARSVGRWQRAGQLLAPRQYLVPITWFAAIVGISLLAFWLMPAERGLGLMLLLSGLTSLLILIKPRPGDTTGDPTQPTKQPFLIAAEVTTGVGMSLMGLILLVKPV